MWSKAKLHTVTRYVEDLRNLLSQSCFTEKKSFIKSFVREVKVTDDEVKINYAMPVSARLISEKVTSVPPIVHGGGR